MGRDEVIPSVADYSTDPIEVIDDRLRHGWQNAIASTRLANGSFLDITVVDQDEGLSGCFFSVRRTVRLYSCDGIAKSNIMPILRSELALEGPVSINWDCKGKTVATSLPKTFGGGLQASIYDICLEWKELPDLRKAAEKALLVEGSAVLSQEWYEDYEGVYRTMELTPEPPRVHLTVDQLLDRVAERLGG